MKKLLKSIPLIIIAITVAVSFSACADSDKREISAPPADNSVVMYLYAFDGTSEAVFGIPNLGHAFLSFYNGTAETVTIGKYDIASGDEITVGTWGQQAHWGIWYNIEAQYMSIGRYKGIVSLARTVSDEERGKINAYLADTDYWTPLTNCSKFALSAWNEGAGEDKIDLGGLVTPARVKAEIEKFSTFEVYRISPVSADAAFYDSESDALKTAPLSEESK